MSTEAMTQVPLEGLTDEQLFNDANSDEPVADEAPPAPAAEPAEQVEQARDEQGRFAEKPADEPEKPVEAATEAEKPAVDDKTGGRVPSFRLKEEAEARRQLENDLAQERADKALLRQRLEAFERPAQKVEQPKEAKPDPLLDPEGYEKYLETKFEEKLLNNHRESSLSQAHRTYKTEFEEAYAAAQKQIDPALKARMQQSRDPGETLIQWHRENKTRAEVGNDPNAYFDKRFEAYLADPANQAKVMERIRGGAQPQPGAPKQASVVSMPPSLTRVAAAVDNTAEDNDISNDGLWRHANA